MITREFQLGDEFPPVDYATWKKAAQADLKGVPFDNKLIGHTYEGIDLQPIYTEETAPTAGDPSGVLRLFEVCKCWGSRCTAGTSGNSTSPPIRPKSTPTFSTT